MERVVIVGAGLAGQAAAAALRQESFDGEVVLIGKETRPPYDRPPLSKEYLRGEKDFEDILLRSQDFYEESDIESRFGDRVSSIDLEESRIEIEGGGWLPYDRLLLATGSRNRRLQIPGIELQGVFDLRTVGDSDSIRQAASSASKAVVIGMGFIGAEVAASLRQMGLEVTVVELFDRPLARAVGPEVSKAVEALHRDHGVEMLFEDSAASIEGDGHAEEVPTESGRKLECDLVVVGIGVEPVVDLAQAAGIDCDDGILVDERCRTSADKVFAAGDVTNHLHPLFGRLRVEHWQNALKQAEAAAANLLGKDAPYDEVHWFWSDQYDSSIHSAGIPNSFEEPVIRGDLEEQDFCLFYLKEDRMIATMGMNRGPEVRAGLRIIRNQTKVSPEELRDEDLDLRELVRQ